MRETFVHDGGGEYFVMDAFITLFIGFRTGLVGNSADME